MFPHMTLRSSLWEINKVTRSNRHHYDDDEEAWPDFRF